MRRLLPVLIVLASFVFAAQASALTPKDGSYTVSGKSKCSSGTCKVKGTIKVKGGKITAGSFKRSDGYDFGLNLGGKKLKVSSKGKFSSFVKTISTRYRFKGKFSTSTKLKATYSGDSFDPAAEIPKFSFSAKRK